MTTSSTYLARVIVAVATPAGSSYLVGILLRVEYLRRLSRFSLKTTVLEAVIANDSAIE